MKKTKLSALLLGASLSLLSVAVQAQEAAEEGKVQLFVRSIEKGMPLDRSISSPKLEVSDLQEARRGVWAAWKQANAKVKEPKLPAVAALDTGLTGKIVLPAALEPSAVMDYYWGRKGEDTLPGGLPVFVHIYFDDAYLVAKDCLDLFQDGMHHFARLAPSGEEVHENRSF